MQLLGESQSLIAITTCLQIWTGVIGSRHAYLFALWARESGWHVFRWSLGSSPVCGAQIPVTLRIKSAFLSSAYRVVPSGFCMLSPPLLLHSSFLHSVFQGPLSSLLCLPLLILVPPHVTVFSLHLRPSPVPWPTPPPVDLCLHIPSSGRSSPHVLGSHIHLLLCPPNFLLP